MSAVDEDYFLLRSRNNIIETHREELKRIIEGHNCVEFLSDGVRRRLREYGVIQKIQGKYFVTELGLKLLEEGES